LNAGAEPDVGRPSMAYTGYVLFMVFLVMVFNNIDRTIVSILVRPIKADFGLTDTQMGLLLGPAFALVYSALVLPLGRWADSGGVRRSIVAACLFVWSLFTAGTAAVQSFLQLFVMRGGGDRAEHLDAFGLSRPARTRSWHVGDLDRCRHGHGPRDDPRRLDAGKLQLAHGLPGGGHSRGSPPS